MVELHYRTTIRHSMCNKDGNLDITTLVGEERNQFIHLIPISFKGIGISFQVTVDMQADK